MPYPCDIPPEEKHGDLLGKSGRILPKLGDNTRNPGDTHSAYVVVHSVRSFDVRLTPGMLVLTLELLSALEIDCLLREVVDECLIVELHFFELRVGVRRVAIPLFADSDCTL